MALKPRIRYPAQTDTDPGYPQGKARNAGTFQDGTGTPLEKDWVNDVWGFLQGLLAAAGLTPTNVPDKVGASQYLDAQRALFLNRNGGTYPLAAALTLNGPGNVTLAGPNTVIQSASLINVTTDGAINVTEDAAITVQSNGKIVLEEQGRIIMLEDSFVSVASGAHIDVTGGPGISVKDTGRLELLEGAALDLYAGSVTSLEGALNVASGGQILAAAAAGLKYNAIAFSWRHSLTPHSVTFSAAAPDWVPNPSTNWVQAHVSAGTRIMFALVLHPGDTLTSVIVRLNGAVGAGHAGVLPTVKPLYSLISVGSSGALTTIASASDSAVSAAAYDVAHNTTLDNSTPGSTLPLTVSSDKYYLVVVGESGAGAQASATALLAISGNGLARSVRTGNELI